jgi:hypothetical protein
MPEINVDEATFQALRLAAGLTDRTEGEVVARIVRDWGAKAAIAAARPGSVSKYSTPVAYGIYAEYRGARVEAVLDPVRETVKIASAPLAGELFASPSAAAIAVVERLNPGRRYANTNGWRFWRLTENDHVIDTIRRGRDE